MRPIATNGEAWSVCVSVSVCLLVTSVNPAEKAEPIEMRFGGMIRVRPTNHVLNGVEISHGKGQFWGLSGPLKSIGTLRCNVCSKRDHFSVNNSMQRKGPFIL